VTERFLTTRALCQRYGVVDRTIDRWVESGTIPEPTRINGRRYWQESALAELERARIGKRKTTAAPLIEESETA